MSAHRQCRTVRVRWRHAVALVPAIVLTASGIALALTSGADGADVSLPAIPNQPLHQPAREGSGIEPVTSGPVGADPGLAPGLALPPGVGPGSADPVRLDALGIPRPALAAYQLAAQLVGRADPSCGIDWALVGAIGRVESDHARFGGNALDAAGVARPGIFGPALDGTHGTARITDSDGGRWDHDTVYDRAVGPMQFIPGTWRVIGADADGDGVRNPQDLNDAATGTAIYLCSGPGDLRRSRDLYRAVLRYNNSDAYVRTVMAIAAAYRRGVTTLPASSLPAAHQDLSGSGTTATGGFRPAGAGASATARPAGSQTRSPAGESGAGAAGGGTGQGGGQVPAPTSAPAVVRAAGPATSAASAVVSLVTSVVTRVVALPTPIVTTTTPCVVNVLGVRVCPLTTITSTTTTTTTTRTVTSTVAPRP